MTSKGQASNNSAIEKDLYIGCLKIKDKLLDECPQFFPNVDKLKECYETTSDLDKKRNADKRSYIVKVPVVSKDTTDDKTKFSVKLPGLTEDKSFTVKKFIQIPRSYIKYIELLIEHMLVDYRDIVNNVKTFVFNDSSEEVKTKLYEHHITTKSDNCIMSVILKFSNYPENDCGILKNYISQKIRDNKYEKQILFNVDNILQNSISKFTTYICSDVVISKMKDMKYTLNYDDIERIILNECIFENTIIKESIHNTLGKIHEDVKTFEENEKKSKGSKSGKAAEAKTNDEPDSATHAACGSVEAGGAD